MYSTVTLAEQLHRERAAEVAANAERARRRAEDATVAAVVEVRARRRFALPRLFHLAAR